VFLKSKFKTFSLTFQREKMKVMEVLKSFALNLSTDRIVNHLNLLSHRISQLN
jgi:hypothetical protein